MDLCFLIKNENKFYLLISKFENNKINNILEETFDNTDFINTYNEFTFITIQNFKIKNLNYKNILEENNTKSLKNLRKKLFNKSYIPKNDLKKLYIISDCYQILNKKFKCQSTSTMTNKIITCNNSTQTSKINNYLYIKYFGFFSIGLFIGYKIK